MDELADQQFLPSRLTNFSTDYRLRTYTAGCYFLQENFELWTAKGMEVVSICTTVPLIFLPAAR